MTPTGYRIAKPMPLLVVYKRDITAVFVVAGAVFVLAGAAASVRMSGRLP